MELTDLKKFKNTGELSEKYKEKAERLPGFEGGNIPVSVLLSNVSNYTKLLRPTMEPNLVSNRLATLGTNPNTFFGTKELTHPNTQPISGLGWSYAASSRANSLTSIKQSGPTQADSSAAGIHPGFAIGAWLGGGALEGANEILASDPERLIGEAGTSTAQIGGISFQRLNVVDAGQMMQDYNNSKDLDWLTNPARAVTKLFGKGLYRRNVQLAATKSANIAGAQTNSALTTAMRLNNAKLNGNSDAQYLYGAKDGKLPHFLDGVVSAFGEGDFPVTGMVSNGEVIEQDGVMHRAGKGKDSKDTLRAYVDGKTTVYPNKGKDRFGIDISDYVWKTGDTDGGLYMLQQYQADKQGNMFYAKNGKLPKFAEGGWGNAVIAGIGALQGLDQYLTALRNKPYKPNTYVDNPYELDALTTLAGLRVNPYPILGQLRNAETRTNRAIDRSGGLSVAQRSLGRLSALNTTQNNIANTLSAIQQQNNQYKANYAQAAINAGQAARQARMQANQWDLDYYSKAHAAQLGGLQMGARNILGALQGWQLNDFKRRQFNDTMSLYRSDQKMKQDELDMLARSLNNNIANNASKWQNSYNKLQNSYLDMMLNIPYFGMTPNPYYFGPRLMLNKGTVA